MRIKPLIFLVDDDPLFLEMLKDSMRNLPPLDYIAFTSGEDCLGNLHLLPDVVVLDYYLDSEGVIAKNGLDILREIKKLLPQIRVIILSGQDDLEIVYRLNKENADDYIVKDHSAFTNIQDALRGILAKNYTGF